MQEKGTISVHSENIFPIIKKFLYSDQDVFLRELVSNAVDATQKLKQLSTMGEYEGDVAQLRIKISINEKLKTLTISDQGLGMTVDEIKKYINQVAFSGATAFVEKYKDKGQQQLIGFFGLGFYAAFMVAHRVDIFTKSYQKDAEAVHWTCDGSTTFELNKAVKKQIGTDVVLHLNQESEGFLQKPKIQEILNRYCKFLPVEIEFNEKVINNPHPLWTQPPADLKDQDYVDFYEELYPFSAPPLFWIHLNVDYPFHLTGILYFPPLTHQVEKSPNKIQLYAKQVFITDEVKDLVPPFLMLLHGVIDSPDIPLNVSRSYLQADSDVKKISTYITKKVADKLDELFKKDRKVYEEKWPSIEFFVKYGMLSDDKFYERAKDFMLLKTVDNKYFTLAAYPEQIKAQQTDKQQNIIILYSTNPDKQDFYIKACQQRGYDVVLLNEQIDNHLLGKLEQKLDKIRFKSVDAEPVEQLIDQPSSSISALNEQEQAQLQTIYKQAIQDTSIIWALAPLAADGLPVAITIPEFMKRLHAMASLQPHANIPSTLSVQAAINTNHPLAKKIITLVDEEKKWTLACTAYQLGLLSQDMLKGPALTQFITSVAAHL